MEHASPGTRVLMGRVIRPHGLQGLLRIRSYAESEETFLNAATVFLRSASGKTDEFKITSVRAHKSGFLMSLEGLTSIEQAEEYRGAEILMQKRNLGPVEEGEYFWGELLDLDVYSDAGEYLGKLSRIIPTGSHDIYLVSKGNKEILIPAVYEVVKEIDLEGCKMIISAMEGLLDLDEI